MEQVRACPHADCKKLAKPSYPATFARVRIVARHPGGRHPLTKQLMARNRRSLTEVTAGAPGLRRLLVDLERQLTSCRTVLDLGCGDASPLRALSVEHLTGLDGFPPALERARTQQTHDELVQGDVRELRTLFAGRRFDAVVALDLIEHLPKEAGWELLAAMESIASRKTIVFTPNGFLPQRGHNDLQEHLSGWDPADFRSRGYRVYGFLGPKSLRGEYHRLRYRPRLFWGVVSVVSQTLLNRHRPESAAALLAVRQLSAA